MFQKRQPKVRAGHRRAVLVLKLHFRSYACAESIALCRAIVLALLAILQITTVVSPISVTGVMGNAPVGVIEDQMSLSSTRRLNISRLQIRMVNQSSHKLIFRMIKSFPILKNFCFLFQIIDFCLHHYKLNVLQKNCEKKNNHV